MSSTESQLKLRFGTEDITFVCLDKKQEKLFDTVWTHNLRSNEKGKNRYGAEDITFVYLDKKQEKIFDTVWAHNLRTNQKKNK